MVANPKQVPTSTNSVKAQMIIDQVLVEGQRLTRRKRSYDTDRLESLLPDGLEIYNRLLADSRAVFIRVVDIPTRTIPELIDQAARYHMDRASDAYDAAYSKVISWRKNWYSLYISAADNMIQNLLSANAYLKALPNDKPYAELKSAYGRLYSWVYISDLFHSIYVGTYLWKETLEKPIMKALYKTIFTYTMV
jgi:hypothetical protein